VHILRCPKCKGSLSPDRSGTICNGCGKIYSLENDILIVTEQTHNFQMYGDKHPIYGSERPLPPENFWIEFVERYRDFQPSDIILDAGGGDSVWTASLDSRVRRIYNVDASLYQLLKARKRDLRRSILINGDVTQISFKDDCIDVIFEIYVFEHLSFKKALKAIEEYYRILKQGGLYLIVTENPFGEYMYKRFLAKLLRRKFGTSDPTHINMHFPRTVRKLLIENNFQIIAEWIPIIGENKTLFNWMFKQKPAKSFLELLFNISYGFLVKKSQSQY